MAIEIVTNQANAQLFVKADRQMKKGNSQESSLNASVANISESMHADEKSESAESQKINEEFLKHIARELDLSNVKREYEVYDKLGKVQIKIYDKETGELIREIPQERIIELAKAMDKATGLIFEQKA